MRNPPVYMRNICWRIFWIYILLEPIGDYFSQWVIILANG